MSFLEEINEMLGIDKVTSDLCVTFMPSRGAVVQGYKKLQEIGEERLVVVAKNKRKISVCGKNLEIFSLAPAEIVVHGKVEKVEEFYE